MRVLRLKGTEVHLQEKERQRLGKEMTLPAEPAEPRDAVVASPWWLLRPSKGLCLPPGLCVPAILLVLLLSGSHKPSNIKISHTVMQRDIGWWSHEITSPSSVVVILVWVSTLCHGHTITNLPNDDFSELVSIIKRCMTTTERFYQSGFLAACNRKLELNFIFKIREFIASDN